MNHPKIRLIKDPTEWENEKLPKNFKSSKAIQIPHTGCNQDALQDFTNYNLSTSSQFNPDQLKHMLTALKDQHGIEPHQIYIVDLREEPHLYINNIPISLGVLNTRHDSQKFHYFNGYNREALFYIENQYKEKILKDFYVTLYAPLNKRACAQKSRYEPHKISAKVTQTEQELVHELGAHYRRFPITDHQQPSHKIFKEFVEFIESLPDDAWVHFHCRGGKGRSGSAVFMYDVIKNKHAYPLSVILERTKQFGISKSIFSPNPKKPEKFKDAQNRKKFLETFYEEYMIKKTSCRHYTQ